MRGKEFIEYENPFDVGMTGLLGFSSGYHAMMNFDALLRIDIREEQLGRRSHLDFGLVGGIAETLPALLPRVTQKTDRSYLDTCLNRYREGAKPSTIWRQAGQGSGRLIPSTWLRF